MGIGSRVDIFTTVHWTTQRFESHCPTLGELFWFGLAHVLGFWWLFPVPVRWLVCWRRRGRCQAVSKCSRLRARRQNRRPPTRGGIALLLLPTPLLLPLLLLLLLLPLPPPLPPRIQLLHPAPLPIFLLLVATSRRFHLVGNCVARQRLPPHCPPHPPTPALTRRHVRIIRHHLRFRNVLFSIL